MKRFFVFMIALFVSAAVYAQQEGRKGVIKVQGHPHKVLTEKYGGKEDATTTRKAVSTRQVDTTWIDPARIECWIDQPELQTGERLIDSAVLIVKWTDGNEIDSLFLWGYRWNPYQYYYDDEGNLDSSFVQQHGIDMLRTVVNNDKRFSVLLQYTGVNGLAVGGIGLNMYNDGISCFPVPIDFDIAGAQHDGYVDFSYFTPNEYCSIGQTSVPRNANNSLNFAEIEYDSTRILMSPFGVEYGRASYDFDYWELNSYISDVQHWQSGWAKNGFWGYYRADSLRVPIPSTNFKNDPDAAEFGVTYEPLLNRQVHGFVFEPGFTVHQFDGNMRFMNCGCAPCPQNVTPTNASSKKK